MMIDVGGYSLDTQATGGDGPTVVLLNAWDETQPSWDPIMAGLTTLGVATLRYDRAGYGASDPRPDRTPLPYSALADELLAVPDRLTPDPVVLVGHSFGALIARVFNDRHPERVCGLILVDGSLPGMKLLADEVLNTDGDGPQATPVDFTAGAAQVPAGLKVPVPAVVVSRTPGRWSPRYLEFDGLWTEDQARVADGYQAAQVIATDAGHYVQTGAPQLVVVAIAAVVGAARTRSMVTLSHGEVAAAGGTLARSAGPTPR